MHVITLNKQPKTSHPPQPRLYFIFFAVIFFIGTLLRFVQFSYNRALWFDEAMLSSNIVQRSVGNLAHPLDMNQAAPIGYLLLSKAAVILFGSNDAALRIIPLISSLAGLVLFYFVARRFLSPAFALLAFTFFALSSHLIYFASEAKQYGNDVTMCLLVLWLAIRLSEDPRYRNRWILFSIITSLCIFSAHPAIFVAIGCLMGLFWQFLHPGARPFKPLWLWISSVWICLSTLLDYAVFLRYSAGNSFFYYSNEGYFLPLPTSLAKIYRIGQIVVDLFCNVWESRLGLPIPRQGALLLLAMVIGVMGFLLFLTRLNKPLIQFVTVPFGLLVLVSFAHKFPFAPRLCLFITPTLIIVVASFLEVVWNVHRFIGQLFVLILVIALLTIPLSASIQNLYCPLTHGEDIREVLTEMRPLVRPGDIICVQTLAEPEFDFYTEIQPQLSLEGIDVNKRRMDGCQLNQFNDTVSKPDLMSLISHFHSKQRVWIVLGQPGFAPNVKSEELILGTFDHFGRRIKTIKELESSSMLYIINPSASLLDTHTGGAI